MGREAECRVRFGGQESRGKALLETTEIVFRGDFRLKIPFADIRMVAARAGKLTVRSAAGEAIFELGAEADAWVQKIRKPAGRLDKLGVKPGSRVTLVGSIETAFVSEVRERGAQVTTGKPPAGGSDLIFFAAERKADLARLEALKGGLQPAGALWVLRVKGPSATVTESQVMAAGKAAGLVDTKVVAFSPTHTAERLVIPVSKR